MTLAGNHIINICLKRTDVNDSYLERYAWFLLNFKNQTKKAYQLGKLSQTDIALAIMSCFNRFFESESSFEQSEEFIIIYNYILS